MSLNCSQLPSISVAISVARDAGRRIHSCCPTCYLTAGRPVRNVRFPRKAAAAKAKQDQPESPTGTLVGTDLPQL
eukprot:2336103-Rhodomonas_salina.1